MKWYIKTFTNVKKKIPYTNDEKRVLKYGWKTDTVYGKIGFLREEYKRLTGDNFLKCELFYKRNGQKNYKYLRNERVWFNISYENQQHW